MIKKIFILIFIVNSYNLDAQYHELGLFVGGSNYIGDVGSDYYIIPSNVAVGLVYKWNLTTRYSLRFSAINTSLKATDYRTNDLNRFRRAYSFENNLTEGSLGIEMNFVDFNLHDEQTNFSPYLYLGLSFISYDEFYFDPSLIPISKPIKYNKAESVSVPIVFGLKTNPSPYWVIGIEIGARYTMTDNLDGSSPSRDIGISNANFGNINNNDWFIFSGLTISFTFGDLPCYCKE